MGKLRAYLELLRPPNVATAFADVLAGFAIAGLANRPALPGLLVSSACLYGGGVVLNDFFDRHLDATERPERPIPSGRVTPTAAATFGGMLLAVGLIAASRTTAEAGLIAAAIAVGVVAYDAWSKHHPVLGPINMGACRGLNLMLGMAAVPTALAAHWALAALPFTYIVAVTALSRGEVHGGRRPVAGFALAAVGGVVLVLAWLAAQPIPQLLGIGATAALGWLVLRAFWRAYQDGGPGAIRHAIKTGVLSLVLLDVALASIYAGTIYGLLVLAVAVVARALARLFAVT